MKKIALYISLFISLTSRAQQLYVASDAILYVSPGANVGVTGDLENDGTILNTGTISLFGNWAINNIFNGNEGNLAFLGGQNQMITIATPLLVNSLLLNQSGDVSYTGNEFRVTDDITFVNGVMKTGENTRFVLGSNVRVIGGSVTSYFQGKLTYQGSGIRKFPMGYEGVYAPITMLEVFGASLGLTVGFQTPNNEQPLPDDELLGISSNGVWEVELAAGTMNGTQVQIDFSGEDLENFGVGNNIRHRVNSPVIAVSDSPGGVYTSLGVESLLDSDSLTRGSILTEIDFELEELETAYLAIGLAPRIDPEGLVYIPEIFSPAATDPDNQTFRVFGERILQENFKMEIYNRFGSLVYSTTTFDEANQVGWDGTNQRTGNEEPSGLYYYQVVLTRINGKIEERSGPFYLQR
ncbi:MAG: gliding motility-associated C-terminal domain-containing protein [Cyclobacteriaceae bacterium]